VIHTEPGEVDPYLNLHSRLKAAALSPESSIRLLRTAAENLIPAEGVMA
jgi:hypothetical protein